MTIENCTLLFSDTMNANNIVAGVRIIKVITSLSQLSGLMIMPILSLIMNHPTVLSPSGAFGQNVPKNVALVKSFVTEQS